MRRASFYIGLIVLGTVGPFAVASFALEVVSIHHTRGQMERLLAGDSVAGTACSPSSPASASSSPPSRARRWRRRSSVDGCRDGRHDARRPRTLADGLLAGHPRVGHRVDPDRHRAGRSSMPSSTAVARSPDRCLARDVGRSSRPLVGAPLAYVLTGVVLGDVSPLEATRRSFRVFRARKIAAALVAIFATIAYVLVLLGLSAGLDVALRVFDALGLGPDSGPAGLILVVVGIVIGVFALGTLIYTALAISLAPQIVMFVGLTRATFGLDHVPRRRRSRSAGAATRPATVPLADPPDAGRASSSVWSAWSASCCRRAPDRADVRVSRCRARSAGRRRSRGDARARG